MSDDGLCEALVKVNIEVAVRLLDVNLVAWSLDITVDVSKLILRKNIVGRVEAVVSVPVLRNLVGHHSLRISEGNLYREIYRLTVEVGVAQTLSRDELDVSEFLNDRVSLIGNTVHEVSAGQVNSDYVCSLVIRILELIDLTYRLVGELEGRLAIDVRLSGRLPLSELALRAIRIVRISREFHSLIEQVECLLAHINTLIKNLLLDGVPGSGLELIGALVVEVTKIECLCDDRSLWLNDDELDVTFLDNLIVDSVLKFNTDERSPADDRLRSVLTNLAWIRLASHWIGVAVGLDATGNDVSAINPLVENAMVLGLLGAILTYSERNLNKIELHSKLLKLSLGAGLDVVIVPRAARVVDNVSVNKLVKVETGLAVVRKLKGRYHLRGVVYTMIKMHTALYRSLVSISTFTKKPTLFVDLLNELAVHIRPRGVIVLRVNIGILLCEVCV